MNPTRRGANSLRVSFAPDSRDSFVAAPLREALTALRAGLERDDPFLLLTGDAGTGKTTVGRQLLEELEPQRYALGGVFGPGEKGEALLSQVVQDFGVRPPRPGDAFLTLEEFLHRWRTAGRGAVLVVDEAQAFDAVALWRLWQLAAAPAAGGPLLHVVLIAQKEPVGVAELARQGHLLPFGTRWQLRPLQESETREFVLDRLRSTGGQTGQPAFGSDALNAIHERSGGVLRQICVLCDRICMWADMEDVRLVSAQVVDAVDDLLRGEWRGPRPEEGPTPTIEPPATHGIHTLRPGLLSAAFPVLTSEVPPGAHLVVSATDDALAAAPTTARDPGPPPEASSQAPIPMALRQTTAKPATERAIMAAVPSVIGRNIEPHGKRPQRLMPKLLAGLLLLVFAASLGLGIQWFLRGSTTLAREPAASSSSGQVPRETIPRAEERRPALAPPAEPVAAPPAAATPSPPFRPAPPPARASRAQPAPRPLPATAAPTASANAAPAMAAGTTAVPCSGPAETMGLCAARPQVPAAPRTATPIPTRPAPPPCIAERAALGLCNVP